MKTLSKRIADDRIKISVKFVDDVHQDNDPDGWAHTAYSVTLRRYVEGRRRQLTTSFRMGVGHIREPEAGEVMSSLLSDAHAGWGSFVEFCDDMGLSTASIKARDTWKACYRTAGQMRRFLGDQFTEYMWETDNDI